MNLIYDPYAPEAGSPPELAGGNELIEIARVAPEETRLRFSAKRLMPVGLRGVGKIVPLGRIREQAERSGVQTIRIEAPERRSLSALLTYCRGISDTLCFRFSISDN